MNQRELLKRLEGRKVRADFPIFLEDNGGKPLIYLDNAATTQKPWSVIKAMGDFYRSCNANVHRGIYRLSEEATERYEGAHRRMASFIGAHSYREIVFVRNATEAINLVAYSWGRANVREGDTILLTEMEHHSNLVPWQILAGEVGARLEFVEFDSRGLLDLEQMETFLRRGVKLLAVTHVSNVLGTINPVKQIVEMAHGYGARVLVDAAQSAPHLPVDVADMGCDFMAFSGHKMMGPTGIGVLYAERGLLERMPPFISGGDMILEVKLRESRWNELPWKFEAGTPPIAEAVGLAAAADYLDELGRAEVLHHERELVSRAMTVLKESDGVEIYGPPADERAGVVSFNLEGVHPHDLAAAFDELGVAVRAGHHCAQPLHDKLGLTASVRISFYVYNDMDEIEAVICGIESAKKTYLL
jgi:cysteine desulfurase/selenocysteine lyase